MKMKINVSIYFNEHEKKNEEYTNGKNQTVKCLLRKLLWNINGGRNETILIKKIYTSRKRPKLLSDHKDYKERSRSNENTMECGQWVLSKRRNKRF